MEVANRWLSLLNSWNVFERQESLSAEVVVRQYIVVVNREKQHGIVVHQLVVIRRAENENMLLFLAMFSIHSQFKAFIEDWVQSCLLHVRLLFSALKDSPGQKLDDDKRVA